VSTCRKSLRRRRRSPRCTKQAAGSDGQAAASLGAPLADDGSAPGRSHALAESMTALAPAVVWLKCAFHGGNRR
jgi:hypothetical protein